MRIALISNKTPDYQSGGIERYLREMVEALTDSGSQVDSILCAPALPVAIPEPYRAYDGAIFAGSAPMYLSCGNEIRALTHRLKCPKILAMVFPFEEVAFYLGRRVAARCAQEVASSGTQMQFIVVPSEYALRDFRAWCQNATLPVVIPHGGHTRIPASQSARLPSRLVSVSRGGPLAVHKNLDAVVSAMAEVRKVRPAAELLLIGRGDHEASPSAAGVRRIGAVSDSTRVDLVCSARAMVLPSAIESFGLSVAESLCLGTPVVALNAAAIPELVEHERNGLLIDPVRQVRIIDGVKLRHLRPDKASLTHSLLHVLSPDTPWTDMSEAAVLSVRDLSWQRTAEGYIRLLSGTS
ncbi:glycosyltransferase family 4 protein [Streptomyces sp. NPDC005279]|uniref:glycosyltransferase family 4 protein n=1 Tax=Streptomyces sp. NPDC005279 TaxID=3364712 RepID=UPI0036C81052